MISSLKTRLVQVWIGLVAATFVSFLLGHDHAGIGAVGVLASLVTAFVKILFVGRDFMELKAAPPALRMVFQAWCLLVCAMVIVLYVAGTPA
ncbi:cytochrome C oxidase subunit IV family protein [Amycolatopsis sp. K13G38]|uniref:Cytochrome C oxidase subunit IV family protein n=1 Tax=Amycolatopsis acididurans TaxID=2724524 RepID=A0ABX1J4J2_9PSEU|nr:cytochrome C oxidase subunit IV family protein [Amycolatopsis acididurans]NKQ54281.1 cytochrome C oxidase subunit IV family protein [Amycolatopsis acididurans]